MTVQVADQVAAGVARYAQRLHARIGSGHHVASPLGAWLLLALAGSASAGPDRATLTEVLGCDVDVARQAAGELLARPHPLVASAAAVWTSPYAPLGAPFDSWLDGLPADVTKGDLPGQAGLDAWAREHTFGLVDRFPLRVNPAVYLVLASALATKVSWENPFTLVPAGSLGAASPWAGRLTTVLRTPVRDPRGHRQFVAATEQAGDVIVHMATAAGGLLVLSVAGLPGISPDRILAAAHQIGSRYATGADVPRRRLADLPLGEGPLWVVREVRAQSETCTAVLPAWSAVSKHDLSDPALGFEAAGKALLPGPHRWAAQQAAVARYSRTGFEAAAVTAGLIAATMRPQRMQRQAELRFAHPYAVVAFTTDGNEGRRPEAARTSPWHGLPVFSAWVSEPEDATDD